MAVRPVASIPLVTSSAVEFAENPDAPLNIENIQVIFHNIWWPQKLAFAKKQTDTCFLDNLF